MSKFDDGQLLDSAIFFRNFYRNSTKVQFRTAREEASVFLEERIFPQKEDQSRENF